MQKLLEKELIVISGRNEDAPGQPLIYATSKNFMDYFGINSTDDLPKIREVLADQIVEGTIINPNDFKSAMYATPSHAEAEQLPETKFEVDESGSLVNKEEPSEE